MKSVFISIFFFLGFQLSAQTYIGIVIEPTANIARIGMEPKQQSDSIRGLMHIDKTIGFGLEIRKQIDRYQSITFIPSYQQYNLLLVKENLQFLDIVHPNLSEIRDLSQGANKVARIRHRQKYIGTQILYARKLQIRGLNSKLRIDMGAGLGLYYLLQSDVKITTEGFSIKGQFSHVFKDSTGIEARPFLIQAIGYGDISYSISPFIDIFGGVKIALPFTSTTTSLPKITLFTPAARVGLRFEL
ncbi:MAG: hypothetical protein ACI80H_001360 [Pseudoalteromonas distincta]|jgi:hypothetical protein